MKDHARRVRAASRRLRTTRTPSNVKVSANGGYMPSVTAARRLSLPQPPTYQTRSTATISPQAPTAAAATRRPHDTPEITVSHRQKPGALEHISQPDRKLSYAAA